MRTWLFGLALLSSLGAALAGTEAHATPVQGEVVANHSRWGYGHSVIVTESVVEQADGSRISVHQLGGSTESIGMRLSHGLQILHLGDRVNLQVEAATTLSGAPLFRLAKVDRLLRPATGAKNRKRRNFVRTTNASDTPIFWKSGCAFLSAAAAGSSQIAGDGEFQIIRDVLETWNQGGSRCSDFTLHFEGTSDKEVGFDGTNLIVFREDVWCRPATESDPEQCYEQSAAGLTTLFFVDDASSDRNGEILDADIELNGVQFAFASVGQSSGTQPCKADLANTLTHEVGHFLGLDHTCWISGGHPLDDRGNAIPVCGSPRLPNDVTEATMYNFQDCGETKKSSLHSQDIGGMCAIYPAGVHSTTCEPANLDSAGCCSVAARDNKHSSPNSLWLALLGLLALVSILRQGAAARRDVT